MSEERIADDVLIRVLPDTLANKIAAGEVVQRPASVEKELVENSIDAGADEIRVSVKSAGSELIEVIDNGCGMGPEDAARCFRRHATSKIETAEDLESIFTLGFRGEALASISAVSQVTLKTRRHHDEAGVLVRVDGGILKASRPCAANRGTSVSVRNLFYNVPARRRFLKSKATEFKHLFETFQRLALANPSIAFTLSKDGEEIHRLPASPRADFEEGLRMRINDLFGEKHAANLIRITQRTSYLSAAGFVGRVELRTRPRGEQYLFVNGRHVKSRALHHAVVAAYGSLLPPKSLPFYTLFLQLDPRHTDVNVHPTKATIKFDDEPGVYGFVKSVVRKALGVVDLIPQLDRGIIGEREPAMRRLYGVPRVPREESPGELREKVDAPPAESKETMEVKVKSEGEPLLWQLHNRFVLTQLRTGLMILDQRAAHKRILYELALESMESGVGTSQQLLFPHTVELSPADFELIAELLPDLKTIGFSIEPLSGYTFVVRGIPAELRSGVEKDILQELLNEYRSSEKTLRIRGREGLARSMARRGAIRAGEPLSPMEMRTLIDRLFMCKMPYVSPDNRPTLVRISIEELEKRFTARR